MAPKIVNAFKIIKGFNVEELRGGYPLLDWRRISTIGWETTQPYDVVEGIGL